MPSPRGHDPLYPAGPAAQVPAKGLAWGTPLQSVWDDGATVKKGSLVQATIGLGQPSLVRGLWSGVRILIE